MSQNFSQEPRSTHEALVSDPAPPKVLRMLKYVPGLNLIPGFNPDIVRSRRESYTKEYQFRPQVERALERKYFENKKLEDVWNDFDLTLRGRVEEYEKRAEAFLTLASSGGLIFIATLYQGYQKKMGALLLWGASFLVFSLILVAIIKIHQTNTAYFRMGEWQKNLANYIRGEIDLAELYWRTGRSHKMSRLFAALSVLTLVLICCGLGFILIFFVIDNIFTGPVVDDLHNCIFNI